MNKAMIDGGEIWTYMYMDAQGTTGLTTSQVSGKQQKLEFSPVQTVQGLFVFPLLA